MAFQIIGLDNLLRRHKHPGQSFPAVGREKFGEVRTGGDLLRATERLCLSERTLEAMARVVAARKDNAATSAKSDRSV